jgi:hypothetical protein
VVMVVCGGVDVCGGGCVCWWWCKVVVVCGGDGVWCSCMVVDRGGC